MLKGMVAFYFCDLETSGFGARDAQIMQFAGQRTDENLRPIGEPHNILIKITQMYCRPSNNSRYRNTRKHCKTA